MSNRAVGLGRCRVQGEPDPFPARSVESSSLLGQGRKGVRRLILASGGMMAERENKLHGALALGIYANSVGQPFLSASRWFSRFRGPPSLSRRRRVLTSFRGASAVPAAISAHIRYRKIKGVWLHQVML